MVQPLNLTVFPSAEHLGRCFQKLLLPEIDLIDMNPEFLGQLNLHDIALL